LRRRSGRPAARLGTPDAECLGGNRLSVSVSSDLVWPPSGQAASSLERRCAGRLRGGEPADRRAIFGHDHGGGRGGAVVYAALGRAPRGPAENPVLGHDGGAGGPLWLLC